MKSKLNRINKIFGGACALALFTTPCFAAPQPVSATILADNGSIAVLQQGNAFSILPTSPTSMAGNWPTPKSFNFTIDDDPRQLSQCRIHVIAWGDGSVAQGMMATFTGNGGTVYTGQPGGPFNVAMSSVTHAPGTAAGLAYANNNANAANIIQHIGPGMNGFVSQPVVTGGIPGTWGPVSLPESKGRDDVRFIWDSRSDALNANPHNYRVISAPCGSVVKRRPPPTPIAHIASWEISGQFNPYNATATSTNAFGNQFEVWTYGYTNNANCTGPVIPFPNKESIAINPTDGRPIDSLSRGASYTNANDLPSIVQTLGATSTTPLKFAPRGLSMHPGPRGECAVVRFTAPQTGRYRWMGRFWGQNVTAGGTNASTMVVVAGNTAHPANDSGTVFGDAATGTPSNNPFASPAAGVNLAQGQTIDFMVGANGSFHADSTGLHGYIQRDEP